MKLYFAPLACSLATRITFYESGVDAQYIYVDMKTKRLPEGSNFFEITPMGQVPVLHTDDGNTLTENAAILQYVAHRCSATLAPTKELERSQLQQWLSFIGTELHKAVFVPLLDSKASEEVKNYARQKVPLRLGLLQNHFSTHDFLLDRFTIADAYLVTVLNWAKPCSIDLTEWTAVHRYYQDLRKRDSVARAVREEWALYQEEQARYAIAQ